MLASPNRRKVAVIGLDGVPHSLLSQLMERDVMPYMRSLARNGSFMPMETTLPPVSSVAWSSFMTARPPDGHGIFGFTDLKPHSLRLHLPSFDDLKCETIWGRLPDHFCVVVNLPFTYPARPLNGLLIAGFVAPDFERAVYPDTLLPWLRGQDYRIDVDAVKGRHDRAGLMSELFHALNVRERVVGALLRNQPWDLFVAVVTGTDRLNHFFFGAADDPDHPFHQDYLDYFRRVDSFVRAFHQELEGNTPFILLSDHGFTHLNGQVYVNNILASLGYLSYMRPNPASVDDVNPRSLAVAMDPTRIYLNCTDRFMEGSLPPFRKHGVRSQLKRALEQLTPADVGIPPDSCRDSFTGRLFQRIIEKESLYSGEYAYLAPDLIVVPERGLDPKATIGSPSAFSKDIFTGMHTHDDAFLLLTGATPNLSGSSAKIWDVGAMVLDLLDRQGRSPFRVG